MPILHIINSLHIKPRSWLPTIAPEIKKDKELFKHLQRWWPSKYDIEIYISQQLKHMSTEFQDKFRQAAWSLKIPDKK
jgi:hypothetical protein